MGVRNAYDYPFNVTRRFLKYGPGSTEENMLDAFLAVVPDHERTVSLAYLLSQAGGDKSSVKHIFEVFQTVGVKFGQMSSTWKLFGEEIARQTASLKDSAKPMTKAQVLEAARGRADREQPQARPGIPGRARAPGTGFGIGHVRIGPRRGAQAASFGDENDPVFPLDFGQAEDYSKTAFWSSDDRYELAQFLRGLASGDADSIIRHGSVMAKGGVPRSLDALKSEILKILSGGSGLRRTCRRIPAFGTSRPWLRALGPWSGRTWC